jgi:hypothetical protein
VTLVERSGVRHVMELEPILCFRMKGIGYSHPEWGHGRWKGELAIAGESWKTDDINELAMDSVHIQQLVRARMDGQEGIGALEQMCIGPHAPSGFTSSWTGHRRGAAPATTRGYETPAYTSEAEELMGARVGSCPS